MKILSVRSQDRLTGLVAVLVLITTPLSAGTFTVSNTNNSGVGSLRDAITQANAGGPGPHTIDVTVTGTIALATPLPALAQGIDISGTGLSNLTINGSTGAGLTLTPASATLNNSSGETSVNDAIVGPGSLTKLGAGTLTLGGTNTYGGGTTVSGGILKGNTSSLQGNIVNNAGVTFELSGAGTYSDNMSGSGSLTKTGAGTLTLSGTNTYGGGTTVSAGILKGDTGSLQGNIINNAAVTFELSGAGTYSDNMSGSGSLTKTGTGTLTLSGTNTYGGGTTVSAGILKGDTGSLQGNIVNNAAVTFELSGAGTYSDNMSGSGSLTKTGTGTLTLSGTNTYGGGTTVSAGVLKGDTGSLQGNIVNNAAVTFELSGAGTYSDNMSGSGSLTKTGTGTLTLSGTNTYGGGTTVSAGILKGDTSSLQGNIVNNAAVTFELSGAGTYSDNMSGSGSLTKTGAGTLTLSGTNTYGGGTTVSAGVLKGDTGSLQGNIVNNAAVTFDQSTSGTYAGAISGSGGLTKEGTGKLTLTGTNTYAGLTTVSAGELAVNGALAGSLSLAASARLSGTGTVSSATINGTVAPGNSIGTLSVTGSYTQNAGSTYEVELNDGGTVAGVNNDLIDVSGAPGTATINGGTIAVQAAPGTYTPGVTYTILQSSGAVSGAGYSSITDNLTQRDFIIIQNANNIQIQVIRSAGNFASLAVTGNQARVAVVLDALDSLSVGDMGLVLDELQKVSASEQLAVMNEMSGELHGGLATVGLQRASQLTQLLSRQLANNPRSAAVGFDAAVQSASVGDIQLVSFEETGGHTSVPEPEHSDWAWSGWATGYGLGGDLDGDGNAAALDYSVGGVLVGMQRQLSNDEIVGLYGGFAVAHTSSSGPNQSAQVENTNIGAYLRRSDDVNYYLLTAGYGYSDYNTFREVSFGPINRTARGDYGGHQAIAYLERGIEFQQGSRTVTPLVGLQYVYLHQKAFTESGAGAMNLSADSVNTHSLRTIVGGRVRHSAIDRGGFTIAPNVHAFWMHELLDSNSALTAQFSTPGSPSFVSRGVNVGRDWAMLGTGLEFRRSAAVRVFFDYDIQLNEHQVLHVANGGFEKAW